MSPEIWGLWQCSLCVRDECALWDLRGYHPGMPECEAALPPPKQQGTDKRCDGKHLPNFTDRGMTALPAPAVD